MTKISRFLFHCLISLLIGNVFGVWTKSVGFGFATSIIALLLICRTE